MARISRALAVHEKKKSQRAVHESGVKTAAVHKSFSGNVTLAMFLSSRGDGFGADYEVPLVHESFSANAGCVFFVHEDGSDMRWNKKSESFMTCS